MKNRCSLACLLLLTGTAVFLSACSESRMLPQKNNVEDIINEQIQKEEKGTEESARPSSTGSLSNHAGEQGSASGESGGQEASTRESIEKTEESSGTGEKVEAEDVAQEGGADLPAPTPVGGPEYGEVDYDLSQMSPDLVYASVYQLMVDPFDFEGKVFRMTGNYYATWYDPTQRYYHYLVIEDAAACCAQGIEFVMGDGSAKYPEEYPKSNAVLEVTGVFETYREEGDDRLYCRIKDANVKLIREIE